jgi:hypothetical protein
LFLPGKAQLFRGNIPLSGDSVAATAGDNRRHKPSNRRFWMLQWKPRLIVLLVVLAVIAAAFGQLTWDALNQLTW